MNDVFIPQIPVHFVYLSSDNEEGPDSEFDASCVSVPRIGESVTPQAGSPKVIVHNVYHNFVKNEEFNPEGFSQYITVVLKEPSA